MDEVISDIGRFPNTINIVAFAGVFFIGELFTGIAEMCVFDRMFLNARYRNDEIGKLENICYGDQAKKDDRKIMFSDIIELSKNDSATFALSDMYFNIHRILGGMFAFSVFSAFVITPLIMCLVNHPLTCFQTLVLFFGNLVLAYLSDKQALKQRFFANNFIYYSAHPQAKCRPSSRFRVRP
ncbi:MAG: hypothetical protein R8K22_08045 [Mariprofundaceae bacterium]